MRDERPPRVFTIAPSAPFLATLVDALHEGRLLPHWRPGDNPLALADVTIFVPTRRAARVLRGLFVEKAGGRSAILPIIRPLGEFDEDAALFEGDGRGLDLAPPIAEMDRLLLLAPLVRQWKARLPAHLLALYDEEVVVPASMADALWLSRDLAALMDEVETEGSQWSDLAGLVEGDLARWWEVTLEFLSIVTEHWPTLLAERGRSSPAAHRNALIDAETNRLIGRAPPGPVIAAGSTGSIPATARLISAISRLPNGAVVLPGLDRELDETGWLKIASLGVDPASFGHPQTALKRLLATVGIQRSDVVELADRAGPGPLRDWVISQAMRPAGTTEQWIAARASIGQAVASSAIAGMSLVEAANEREEACTIALALRRAIEEPGHVAALVTGDRTLARRVASELLRFGIEADDSGGMLLLQSSVGSLMRLIAEVAARPGDPVAIVSLLKHPLLRLGLSPAVVREGSGIIELAALRGGRGKPDIATLAHLFERRLREARDEPRKPRWLSRLTDDRLVSAHEVLAILSRAFSPLVAMRDQREIDIRAAMQATIEALEACGVDEDGSLAPLYDGEAGQAFAAFARSLLAAEATLAVNLVEWPDIVLALMSGAMVKPSPGTDPRVHIWGFLEARLQRVDTLVVGGLNEGTFPPRVPGDRFMSRTMKGDLALEPPERRIGQAAHDFMMALGHEQIILTRSARVGDAPAVASRWLQRLSTCLGEEATGGLRARGNILLALARHIDDATPVDFAPRPRPTPPVAARPRHFSVTEVETLRRDPYAVYARRILGLEPLEPLVRDPAASDRGILFHDILHRFTTEVADPFSPDALPRLVEIGRDLFARADLPADVHTVWWPRFERLAPSIVEWERNQRPAGVVERLAELRAAAMVVGASGVTLSGRADRIDLRPGGMADILDYKTGSSPSKGQAHTLLAPQLALEGALLARGAFDPGGHGRQPAELAYVRLKPSGQVSEESILEHKRQWRSAADLSDEAWSKLERLLARYEDPGFGYLSRALPFREGDTDGDYDHLARVLEWSAGTDEADEGA